MPSRPRQSGHSAPTLESLLAGFPPQVDALALLARRFMKATVPDAREKILLGWKAISYSQPRYFCGIFLSSDGVQLIFEHGVLLADPDSLLQGQGKQVRHVSLTTERLRHPGLKLLVETAAAHAASPLRPRKS